MNRELMDLFISINTEYTLIWETKAGKRKLSKVDKQGLEDIKNSDDFKKVIDITENK